MYVCLWVGVWLLGEREREDGFAKSVSLCV